MGRIMNKKSKTDREHIALPGNGPSRPTVEAPAPDGKDSLEIQGREKSR
jgi:hypothetical protein